MKKRLDILAQVCLCCIWLKDKESVHLTWLQADDASAVTMAESSLAGLQTDQNHKSHVTGEN